MKKIQVPKLDHVHSVLDGYTMQALDTVIGAITNPSGRNPLTSGRLHGSEPC